MIQNIPYKHRTHKQLLDKIKKLQNTLQLRDWQIDLVTGKDIPKCLGEKAENASSAFIDDDTLKATVYINLED